jgi:two-component system sensor histidine kinase KdpD
MTRGARVLLGEYGWALSVSVLATLTCWCADPFLTHTDEALLFLLGVLLVAARTSRGPALLSVLLGVASFDYFFVEPLFTLNVADSRFFTTFAVMLGVGLTVSGMTARIREQAEEARLRERRTAALHAMAGDLLGVTGLVPLAAATARHARDLLETEAVVLLGPPALWPSPAPTGAVRVLGGPAEEEAARCASEGGHPAGRGTSVVPEARGYFVPLLGTAGPLGVLGVATDESEDPIPGPTRTLVEAMAAQATLAAERTRLADEGATARVEAETERTRASLLRTVSHDLRTPLASIRGGAEALLEGGASAGVPGERELLESIRDESARLAGLVDSLLELTRIESESFRPRKEWCPLEELVASALGRAEGVLGGRPVRVDLGPGMLMVPVDGALLEQVLANLLENAAKYSPAGSPVEILAREAEGGVAVEVADRGSGIPAGMERRVFEPFVRGEGAGAAGTGLGLAICHAVLRVHGGTIAASLREGGGSVIRMFLPVEGTPPAVEVEP